MMERAAREDALVWRGAQPLRRDEFLHAASAVADCLPANRYLVNLCEQRENFLLLFAAAMLARRTQLMPSARGETALASCVPTIPTAFASATRTWAIGARRAGRRLRRNSHRTTTTW